MVAKMAAPCCTSAVQMAVSLHDAAQCGGVLGVGGGHERPLGTPPAPSPPTRAARAVRAHQPWLSGELTLAPAAMRKSTMG